MPRTIQGLHRFGLQHIGEIYVVSDETLEAADSRRKCWICGGKFELGDGMTIAILQRAKNKTIHHAAAKHNRPSPTQPRAAIVAAARGIRRI